MAHLKRDVNRFLFKHRNKGIPRLMLWICISNALVFLITVMIGINFFAEFVANIICSPVIVRILHAVKRN